MDRRRGKNTSYFLRLEHSNYNNKHIEQLIDSNGGTISDPSNILQMEKDYYQNLYEDRYFDDHEMNEANRSFFDNLNIPILSEIEKNKCENVLSESELLKAIKAMKNGTSPGTDGLVTEFYKFFWSDIKNLLLSCLNYELETGILSIEQRRGILTLIPKKDKNRLYLKNWRPLTLLNTDYKILAKALANRLTEYLPFLIEDDQTGYIPGRFIGCNIRLVEYIIIYTTLNKVTGILLTIDFEKAFDSLRWSFIQKSLEAFNFGDRFRSFIKTMYKEISTAVINNGFTSDWFYPQRGVRQGCPLSPYLFLLSAEILACNIRQNKNINGIHINNIEIKLSQLADDTTCFIKNENSLHHLLDTFKLFNKCAGLGINIDKTSARCLGSFTPSADKLMGLEWSQEPVYTLGVHISGNESEHYTLNFLPKIIKMQQLLKSWKCRYLSLKGKVTIINTLALSQLIYLCSILYVPEVVYSEVKKIIVDFLWDGKPAKIAYNTLIQGIDEGGLKLIDLKTKVKSLSVSWIKRLADESNAKWKSIPKLLYNCQDLKFFFMCNHARITSDIQPKFYKYINHIWSEMMEVNEPSLSIIRNQVLWQNRYITIQNSSFHWDHWKRAGILKVHDLMADNNFMSAEELSEKYNIRINFLEALQIRQSLPHSWRTILTINKPIKIQNNVVFYNNKEVNSLFKSDAKQIYSFFSSKNKSKPTCIDKWQNIYPNSQDTNWPYIFKLSFISSRETNLQSFQYRVLHRVITCRKKLHEMKLVDNPKCTVCPDIDNLQHFFVQCKYVNIFWTELFSWLNSKFNYNLIVNEQDILFGVSGISDTILVVNYIILHAKWYIYKNRINDNHSLAISSFKGQLKYKLKIEKIITREQPEKFIKFKALFDEL